MKIGSVILAAIIAASAANAARAATQWDAVKDFSFTSDPNNAWSYGYGVAGTSFTAFSQYATEANTGFTFFEFNGGIPLVGYDQRAAFVPFKGSTQLSVPDALLVHPGDQDVIVRWSAPSAGTYAYSGLFELLDFSPQGILGKVFLNGEALYAQALTGNGANETNKTAGQSESFSGTVHLQAGDTLSFAVNHGENSYWHDSTGLSVHIASVPGPVAGQGLLTAGLAGLGFAFARRRSERSRARDTA